MSEVHDAALSLLATPQLGTYLTPEGREMVLRALDEHEAELRNQQDEYTRMDREWGAALDAMQKRAELAEAQLAAIRAALNSPVPVAVKEVDPPSAAPSPSGTGTGDALFAYPFDLCLCGHTRVMHDGWAARCFATDSNTDAAGRFQCCACPKFQPAEAGKEEAHDDTRGIAPRSREGREDTPAATEAERGKDRALPEPRERERAAQVGAESGDRDGRVRGRTGAAGREPAVRGSVRPESDGDVLRPRDAVQRDAEAGALELASEGLNKAQLRWGFVGSPELGAWHLWAGPDVAEAECGETIDTDAKISFLSFERGEAMDAEQICDDCTQIDSRNAAQEQPKAEPEKEAPAPKKTACAKCGKGTKRTCPSDAKGEPFQKYRGKPLCSACEHDLVPKCTGWNEAANVPCTAQATEENGRCRRHKNQVRNVEAVA